MQLAGTKREEQSLESAPKNSYSGNFAHINQKNLWWCLVSRSGPHDQAASN